ncbi:2OG-Fe(II) oxygenase [Nocardia sp. XZ_19_385]|uniref:2OG-Fe(II) oxygenase n=1 Tax=Nocardia sp. XZ_19_385 TaxID=2769488 RepID=UPI00188F3677|nr:2OG-Fe(II) oxygenase [Nocardia sp. XZ_19_385]
MSDSTLRAIGELMGSVSSAGSFAAQRTGSAENLVVEVEGVGRLELPVPPGQARRLCEVARPARYGLREQTLLDANVRDTWEVPRERVAIDEGRWHETLLPLLDTLRGELGLSADCELSAELHSMLVYEPGQFFQRHQDSEKTEGMIGTLVVTLPSAFTGGELVIEQQGTRVIDKGSPERLSFVAFYSDCEHEVLPVTDGYRITLTYNLMAKGRTGPDGTDFARHSSVALLAEQLRAHFTTPVESADSYPQSAPRPPRQLVYLMDHQYSQNGFGWDRLKGGDAGRTGMLLAAAEIAGYDTALALAEAEECYEEEDYTTSMLIYRQRWERVADGWKCVERSEVDFDDEGEMIDPVSDDVARLPVRSSLPLEPGSDELGELRWSDLTLTWLIDRSGAAGKPEAARVLDEELCTGATTSALEPFASELEGYMGNEGNNANFWYRRAAIVVRPHQ